MCVSTVFPSYSWNLHAPFFDVLFLLGAGRPIRFSRDQKGFSASTNDSVWQRHESATIGRFPRDRIERSLSLLFSLQRNRRWREEKEAIRESRREEREREREKQEREKSFHKNEKRLSTKRCIRKTKPNFFQLQPKRKRTMALSVRGLPKLSVSTSRIESRRVIQIKLRSHPPPLSWKKKKKRMCVREITEKNRNERKCDVFSFLPFLSFSFPFLFFFFVRFC